MTLEASASHLCVQRESKSAQLQGWRVDLKEMSLFEQAHMCVGM
jgi:hypothetical protein